MKSGNSRAPLVTLCAFLAGTTMLAGVAEHTVAAPAGEQAMEQQLAALRSAPADPRLAQQGRGQARQIFQLGAQPLTEALRQFSARTGIQVAYNSPELAGRMTDGLSGMFTPEEALAKLLEKSGAEYRFTYDDAVLVRVAQAGPMQTDATLATINVQGSEAEATPDDSGETAWGPVDGYVATRSATGTKTDTPLINVPQSVSVVTSDQMEARAVQEESEALLYTPGVFAQPYGSALNQYNPYYQIRGFSSGEGGSFTDGLPVPTNFRVEPYGHERIEVLRGPSSVLYGQGDPGGLVNRVHKRPNEAAFGELQFAVGNFDRAQPAFDFGGPLDQNGKVLYRLTGLGGFGDATVDYDVGPSLPYERNYLTPSLTFKPTSRTSLTLRYEFLKDDTGQDTSYLGDDGKLTRIRSDQPNAGDFEYEHSLFGYNFEHEFNSGIKIRQNLHYLDLDYDYVSMYVWGRTGSRLHRSAESFDQTFDGLYTDTMVEIPLTTGPAEHKILTGIDYRRTEDRTSFGDSFFGTVLPPDLNVNDPDYFQPVVLPIKSQDALAAYQDTLVKSTTRGLYLQDQVMLFDKLIVTLGARQDSFDADATDELFGGTTSQSEDALTYRAGVNYRMRSGLTPYVSYAESFLPVAGIDANGILFEPTTGTQYEAGIKFQPALFKGTITLAAYDLTKQNVLTTDPNNPTFSVQTGEIRNRGLEIEANAEITRNFRLHAAYSHIDGEITSSNEGDAGNRPQLTPENMASLWGEYEWNRGLFAGFALNAGVRFIGSNFADNANTFENGAYTIFDVGARYDLSRVSPGLNGAELALNVTNLLNEEHQACWSTFDCRWVAPRTILGTVTYRW